MQKSYYGNTELTFDDDRLTVQLRPKQRITGFLIFGFWFYSGTMSLISGITKHHTAFIVIGAVFMLFNGLMLAMQFAPANSPSVFDRASGTFRRGKLVKPFSELQQVTVGKQGSSQYVVFLKVQGAAKIPVNLLNPVKEEAEAHRLAQDISGFTGIPLADTALSQQAPVG
jgi:hypothetical protein